MNTVIVTSSKTVMKASTQPDTTPGRISGSVTRRNTVTAAGAERHRGVLDGAVHAGRGRQHEAQRKRHHDDDVRQHQPDEGAADADLVKKRRKAMPSTTCGIISGDMKKRRHRLAAGEAVARDGERRRHREQRRRWSRTAPPSQRLVAERA